MSIKIISKTLTTFKPKAGYKFKAAFYVKKDIIYLDEGLLELRNLHAALRFIFPDEIFDEVAIVTNTSMGWGHNGYKGNIYTHKGKVMKPYPELENLIWLNQKHRDIHRENWGAYQDELYEFRIFEKEE